VKKLAWWFLTRNCLREKIQVVLARMASDGVANLTKNCANKKLTRWLQNDRVILERALTYTADGKMGRSIGEVI